MRIQLESAHPIKFLNSLCDFPEDDSGGSDQSRLRADLPLELLESGI